MKSENPKVDVIELILVRIMLEIQIFLQKVLQTIDMMSDYW